MDDTQLPQQNDAALDFLNAEGPLPHDIFTDDDSDTEDPEGPAGQSREAGLDMFKPFPRLRPVRLQKVGNRGPSPTIPNLTPGARRIP